MPNRRDLAVANDTKASQRNHTGLVLRSALVLYADCTAYMQVDSPK